MKQNNDDDRTTARRILDAAAELLAAEGYPALSMRRVAAKVGISQAAIYRHFEDKAELVSRLVAEGYGELAERIQAIAAAAAEPKAAEAERILADTFRAYVDFAAARPALFKALLLQDIGPAGSDLAAFGRGVSERRSTFALLTELLRRGMEAGRFAPADPELTAQAVWAAFFGLASRIVIENVPEERREALVERQIQLVLHGLRA